ncbi:4-amino-4-deoxy-L-arabinose-phosphoundecaprenol flippase subunit ArnE [Paenibacillus plantiphilus]|uniref:4-amino-4-deoxy-L-arabinose-phosphoundecaprenol flippase subunit ArnE n=1 Tax=Paenibacillus plantiphilus TaxID=2905650 RepID=A0ABM9CFW9_9BACL|nr:EamA family transporter [Paenibacillus plantiphilus]CAH1211691.1 4-amino-4-deoxy-L-arabinose-phosphoundecaprenol flippase subunit ArnE [Paenibacillus plantiphilus]
MVEQAAAAAIVILSGVFHATWNMLAKNSLNKNVFLWYSQLVAILIFLPWAIMDLQTASFVWESVLLLAASAVIHGIYMLLLAQAYIVGDLSQVYPIMRGTSPLLVPLVAVTVLAEPLPIGGWIGILIIVAGIFMISNGFHFRSQGLAAVYAFAVGISITMYTVIDKLALEFVQPALLNLITNIGNLAVLSFVVMRGNDMSQEWRKNKRAIIVAGVLAPSGYLLFLFALSLAPLGVLAPMREIGTVFATLFAVVLLKEKQGARRIWSSIVITAGIICLGLFG